MNKEQFRHWANRLVGMKLIFNIYGEIREEPTSGLNYFKAFGDGLDLRIFETERESLEEHEVSPGWGEIAIVSIFKVPIEDVYASFEVHKKSNEVFMLVDPPHMTAGLLKKLKEEDRV